MIELDHFCIFYESITYGRTDRWTDTCSYRDARTHLKMVVGIYNSFDIVFSPSLAPTPNFIEIGQKTQVENFRYWSVLVGRAGRSKNGCRHFELILYCFWSIISPHTKFHPNRTENTEIENFHYSLVLVSRAGMSRNGRSHFKYSGSVQNQIG